MYVPYSAWTQGQGIGLEGPIGPWKANVWLSIHTLTIIVDLRTSILLNIYFESSRATPGNPS